MAFTEREMKKLNAEVRDWDIKGDLWAGMTIMNVARRYYLTVRQVCKIAGINIMDVDVYKPINNPKFDPITGAGGMNLSAKASEMKSLIMKEQK